MPSISLKLIIGLQWMLIMWGSYWGASTYSWTNITLLAIGVWALADKQSVDSVFLFMILLFISIIIDIVLLSIFPVSQGSSGFLKFSFGMAIINLIFKPFYILLLYQMYKDRGGEYNINFGPNTTAYDNIGASGDHEQNHGSTASFNSPVIVKS